MHTPLLRWLSFRVRLACIIALIIGSILPPFIPASALSSGEPGNAGDGSEQTPQFLFVEEGFLMKTSSIGSQGQRMAYGQGIVYTVKPGEGIETVARNFHISVDTIRWANNLDS